uniref:Uncharacterized protein n=1 Tax=Anopheles culicifacies TaxID=139723 RepID=A0A182M3Y2_9DIPT
MTFHEHYGNILTKAYKTLGLIRKFSADITDPLCLKSLYCSLVRSILEYGSIVWCPSASLWIAKLEEVQRYFTRLAIRRSLGSFTHALPSYDTRCQLLGLAPPEKRRSMASAVFIAGLLLLLPILLIFSSAQGYTSHSNSSALVLHWLSCPDARAPVITTLSSDLFEHCASLMRSRTPRNGLKVFAQKEKKTSKQCFGFRYLALDHVQVFRYQRQCKGKS